MHLQLFGEFLCPKLQEGFEPLVNISDFISIRFGFYALSRIPVLFDGLQCVFQCRCFLFHQIVVLLEALVARAKLLAFLLGLEQSLSKFIGYLF